MIGKKAGVAFAIIFLVGLFPVYQLFSPHFSKTEEPEPSVASEPALKSIESSIEPGETLFSIFQKHGLNIDELFAMKQAAASVYRLRQVHPGQSYRFVVDDRNCVSAFTYQINDNTELKIQRQEDGFSAQKCETPYESRALTISGQIEETLVGALGASKEDLSLAISLSDILAWDIDFNVDLRKGDSFKVIAEGLYLNGEFKKYGKILAIEMINDGRTHKAYLFDQNGRSDYFDPDGKSLRKAFLKAPLSFRRISSSFSHSRRHPILRIHRPHHGIDYAAPTGTPVSATADGRVTFSGYKGQYGKLVILSHRNGMQTYYGHLSRIAPGVGAGKTVQQGDLMGYVGMTGLATGPHLHYEMRQNGRPINPARFKMEAGPAVAKASMPEFRQLAAAVDQVFARSVFYSAVAAKDSRSDAGDLAFMLSSQ
ncbi:MAG TPA: peptidoglycan DD-metalloendopeptidase family protein [Smithellaceae bacterium]|nr:peptidoglycan DD-metalloendopeptidase family protein [Smithellaceae bacterium]